MLSVIQGGATYLKQKQVIDGRIGLLYYVWVGPSQKHLIVTSFPKAKLEDGYDGFRRDFEPRLRAFKDCSYEAVVMADEVIFTITMPNVIPMSEHMELMNVFKSALKEHRIMMNPIEYDIEDEKDLIKEKKAQSEENIIAN